MVNFCKLHQKVFKVKTMMEFCQAEILGMILQTRALLEFWYLSLSMGLFAKLFKKERQRKATCLIF